VFVFGVLTVALQDISKVASDNAKITYDFFMFLIFIIKDIKKNMPYIKKCNACFERFPASKKT
jgi:hypothetical protein